MRVALVLAALAALAACGADGGGARAADAAPILLYTGAGTSPNDVAAVEAVLRRGHLAYATASAPRLNAMSASRLRAHRLLIVPGGDFERIGNGLTPVATANVRRAIGEGLNYLGLCAGAFLAGDSPYNGLDLTSGVRFRFYAAESRGTRKAVVPVAVAGGPTLAQYWEDGPELTGWGAVVGRYPDATPAIVEGRFGAGRVILTGVHPEAPAGWWRGLADPTSADEANAYAATLIRAALAGDSLPHF